MRVPFAPRTATALSLLEPMTAPTPDRAAILPFSFTMPASSERFSPAGPMQEIVQLPGSPRLGLQHVVGLVGVLAPQMSGLLETRAGPRR